MTVPPEAVTAALKAAPQVHLGRPGQWEPICSEADMRRILETAAPLIRAEAAAAERESIRQLAREVRASYALDPNSAVSVLREFADLIGDPA